MTGALSMNHAFPQNDERGESLTPTPSVGIIYKRLHEPARVEFHKLRDWLEKKGLRVFCEELGAQEETIDPFHEETTIPGTVDWVVVLGGDGTLLGAARRIGRHGIPMLGVNMGGLGFLTGIPLERMYPVVEAMIAGELEMESRTMLETRVLREGKEVVRFQVLNDVVINKSTLARIIDLNVTINDEFLTIFRADGLIISTPTGSTAYNLAAGGPILHPTLESIILTPICPFMLTNRPLIVPDHATIGVRMEGRSEKAVILTFDGQVGFQLKEGDEVLIGKSPASIRLLRPKDQSFFRILRTKLMWGRTTYHRHGDQ